MKKLLVLLMICCMCTACGTKEDTVMETPEQAGDVVEDVEEVVTDDVEDVTEDVEDAEEVTEETETAESVTVSPLPTTIDMNALDKCTLAVSFEEGDAYVDDEGKMQLDVTVYTYDLYDMVDMANLKEGDTIVIQGNDVAVESLERLESGLVIINGGIDNGGYDLWHDESGVYFEQGYSDVKSYYELGEATIRVSADFEFVDSSDLDQGEVTYYPGDFLTDAAGIVYHFNPNNTSIVVEDGQIIQMTRIYTP